DEDAARAGHPRPLRRRGTGTGCRVGTCGSRGSRRGQHDRLAINEEATAEREPAHLAVAVLEADVALLDARDRADEAVSQFHHAALLSGEPRHHLAAAGTPIAREDVVAVPVAHAVTSVPMCSPRSARVMLPAGSMPKTCIGILLSMQRLNAV